MLSKMNNPYIIRRTYKMKHGFSTGNVLVANENGYSIIKADGSKIDFDSFGNRISKGDELTKNARVGEFVEYIPDNANYAVAGRDAGCSSIQVYNPSKICIWRVFKNDSSGVELISDDAVGDLMLSGKSGHANLPRIMAGFAEAFVNTEFAVSGRSLGDHFDNYVDVNSKIKSAISTEGRSTCGYEDDVRHIKENGLDGVTPIWLNSRFVVLHDNAYFYGIRTLKNGEVNKCKMYEEVDGEVTSAGCEFGVRLVIKLKPYIRILEGTGTESSPYIILN